MPQPREREPLGGRDSAGGRLVVVGEMRRVGRLVSRAWLAHYRVVPAERYTHGHHDSVLRSHLWRTAENSAAYLLPHLAPGQQVLDVGCGPGTITADLAALVSPGSVLAVDNAATAVELCRRTLAQRRVANARVEQADVYRLPYGDGSFDVVHAHQVLQHLSDPVAALAEMRRVCRADGWVAARDGDYPAMVWYPDEPGLDRWLEIYLAVARGNHAEPAAGRQLLAWAHAAGFSEVRPSASTWCHATPEDRRWWGDLWAERITSSDVAEQAVTGGHATGDELVEIALAWQRWSEDDDGWFLVPHGEVLCRP